MIKTRQGLIEILHYDGINVYGDEVATNIKERSVALAAQNLIPCVIVNLASKY
jgi:hypothetical protein